MRFKINQMSYIDDKIVPAEASIEVAPIGKNADGTPRHHIPGPHWHPVDDEAKALCEQHGIKYTGEVPDALPMLMDEMEKKMEREVGGIDTEKLGDAIAAGIVKANKASATGTALPSPKR